MTDKTNKPGSRKGSQSKPFEKKDGKAKPQRAAKREGTARSAKTPAAFEKSTPRSAKAPAAFEKKAPARKTQRSAAKPARTTAQEPTSRPVSKSYERRKPAKQVKAPNSSTPKAVKNNDETVRLNKYIANAGICSRREADVLIAAGSVTVNGEVVTQMGFQVKPTDTVCYGGERLRSEPKRYILLNKPKGYITTVDDPQERKTVMALVQNACRERIYPVGRLDRQTTGLLLFTNDGELSKKLTHPSTGVYKIYEAELDKPLTHTDMKKILEGFELDDGFIKADDIQYAGNGDNRKVIGIQLHSGRNRIVRRLFEALGYDVVRLDRVVFAGLTKKDLPRGRWRELTEKEIGYLKMI